ncbi:MAG TPA: sporulation protein [Myxococcaceae bacterium]|nr:sporulation protein [Myxococcaceae bacterium]
MSFFNQLLASIGIGSAKVDTRLKGGQVRVGEQLEGTVHIQGGSTEQHIDNIYLHLMTQYTQEQNDQTVKVNTVVTKWQLSSAFTIHAGESKQVPFAFTVPLNTPVSASRAPVWLQTGLDIDSAVDPGDSDRLQVLPHPHMQAVLDAVTSMGFQPKTVTNEYSSRLGRGLPFVQEFEFYPSSSFRGSVKELELVFFIEPEGVEVIVEVDRRARGLTGLFEQALALDERKQRARFSKQELRMGSRHIAEQLSHIIERHAR